MTERKGITLPDYTLSEELINAISHGFGAVLGIVALVLCVVKSVAAGDVTAVVCSSIYGSSMIIMYMMSTMYHALKRNRAKKVFRVIDHCSVYFLIAGTYTPYTLVGLKGAIGWVLFGIVWAAAAVGIPLNAVSLSKFKVFSMITYIAAGWVVIIAMKPLIERVPIEGVVYLLLGGLSYTIGAVLYVVSKKKKLRYGHSIFHIFVLLGSLLHFFSIYFYVI
jgi:channel protein, hemolysin III family